MAFAAVFLVILIATPSAFAAQHNIDWSLGSDYSSWATKSLNAGDTLVFSYDSSHNVDVVSKSDYEKCDSSNALQTHSDGHTTITLKQGPTYIICGTPGHCSGGMKLQVIAKASGSTGSTSSTTGSTPSGSGSTDSTASGNGPAGGSSAGHLMFGVPLVLGTTLFAFMG